ncbi:hypothetical protein C1646_775002 [Rhizophagus diaphanus]|nr:hypothetical protein C1646_775002 [Rhizophagus diaphanus] [Rhizophagus sp. MUCL 43196]
MTSEMDLLRQENARLMAENAEFKVKYDEAKDEITKLRAELRNRIEELEKARIDTAVKNTRRDVKNVRRDAENAELKAKVAKLEEDSRHPQKDSSPKKLADIPDSVIANEVVSVNFKSSEEKIMDSFLDEVNKKIVSDGIRQRKRDEKLAKVESISPEKGKQVSVDKRALCKENQKKQREKFIQEVSEGAVTELGSNSLDVCLEKTIRSCDPLAVEMRMPTFSLLYEKLCDAVIITDCATQEAIFCYCQFGKALIQRQGEIASEKQVDPESNTVSRILNIEVKAQLPTGTSDALLRKRIEHAKKLYTLFNAIEFSSENVDYYGITDETSCPLCKLDYDDEEGIEGKYKARSYFIKCEQREIEIVA